ncbi:MAG: tRNA (adenine(57)-N(1)/adenine(58)-N(1))-methyltransferase TrmI [Candidatus Heimdallarchaeota archaeon LC_2]|nr:MAG: tRNA (adenine(57)-N(1)/adenine(58)-N(1))-methyltransferase TrmI [Candidatus Heimdallarchaeota archaeon LC_2]
MDNSGKFQIGDPVFIVYDRRRYWMKTVEEKEFHCNYGLIKLGELVGKTDGSLIETNKGKKLRVYFPKINDWIRSFEHQGQIIYEKDAAQIAFLLDIKSGSIIYEAGTGSGALTSYLSQIVGPTGKIVTHDVRNAAKKTAQKNLGRMGVTNVEFNLRDVIEEGFVEGKADAIILDMVDPWRVLSHVQNVLKIGKKIVIFIPSYNQIEKTFVALKEYKFREIRAIELLEREIQLKENAIRPSTRMIGHTGFLMEAIFVEKVNHESINNLVVE